jgi:hypothetical protein
MWMTSEDWVKLKQFTCLLDVLKVIERKGKVKDKVVPVLK